MTTKLRNPHYLPEAGDYSPLVDIHGTLKLTCQKKSPENKGRAPTGNFKIPTIDCFRDFAVSFREGKNSVIFFQKGNLFFFVPLRRCVTGRNIRVGGWVGLAYWLQLGWFLGL